MIGWIIALSIFEIITTLLVSSVKIVLDIAERVFFEISFLGVKLFSYDSAKPQIKTEKPKSVKPKKPEEKGKLTKLLKEYAKGKHKKELVEELLELLKVFCVKFKMLLSHVRFKKVHLDLTVATPDAADTAILYGRLCSVIYSLVALLESAVNFTPKKISVKTDFTSEDLKLVLSGVIKVRVLYVLGFAVSLAFSVLKMKIGDIKNGRT